MNGLVNRKIIEKILEPFSLSVAQKQDLLTLLKEFKKNNILVANFVDYLEIFKAGQLVFTRERGRQAQKTWELITLKCSKCGRFMRLLPVNINEGTQTEDDSKSVWMCLNPQCLESIYNRESVREIIEKRQHAANQKR